MTDPGFRDEELLASVILRLLGEVRHVAVGASSPIPATAALLARHLGGGRPFVSLLSSERHNFFTDGGRELFDCGGQGRIDAFFFSGGQIAGGAQIKPLAVGGFAKPEMPFPSPLRS